MERLEGVAGQCPDTPEREVASLRAGPFPVCGEVGRIGGYRFLMGDYRVIFEIEHGTLIVLAVAHRKEIYR